MNELKTWSFEGSEIRTVELNGEPWWVLKDVCDVLELGSPHKVADRLEEDERNQIPLTDSLGREQNTTIVNESGLYSVILRSDKPQAKPFRKWVTGEVLPSIRRHGAYMTPDVLEQTIQNPDFLIGLATELKTEKEKNRQLESKIETDKPKVIFSDAVCASQSSILIGDLAKIIRQNGHEIGQNRLFTWMRDNGYLIKGGSSKNMPTQRSMDAGWFEIKETVIAHSDGHTTINKTPKVTGRGQQYFINLFLGKNAAEPEVSDNAD